MIDRAARGDRAIILHPIFSDTDPSAIAEFKELARSAAVDVVAVLTAPRRRADSKYFVGAGKITELEQSVQLHEANLVLVSHPLSAIQERNIENQVGCRVLDRTTLILDIFAQRAQSYEGRLQVELAQLRHLSTRLVRGWTHLERQKGGIGLRGPGETQLETDRRLVGHRIRQLRQKLDKVERQRRQSRRQRRRSNQPRIALVGYTNAGKSTLFNRLSGAQVQAKDLLFATLDPTVRRIEGLPCGPVLITDTVGFVSNLPHELVAAFRSTLDETCAADLLLHVVDSTDSERHLREQQVQEVLDEIGAGDIPSIKVLNKIDLIQRPVRVEHSESGRPLSVSVSALTGSGMQELLRAVDEYLGEQRLQRWVALPGTAGKLRAELFAIGAVQEEKATPEGEWALLIDLPQSAADRLCQQSGIAGEMARLHLR